MSYDNVTELWCITNTGEEGGIDCLIFKEDEDDGYNIKGIAPYSFEGVDHVEGETGTFEIYFVKNVGCILDSSNSMHCSRDI